MSNSFEASGTASLVLTAENFSASAGDPVQTTCTVGSRQYSAWSFSGVKTGQSVAGIVTGLPVDCRGVKVEIEVNAIPGENCAETEDVYRVRLSQGIGEISGVPVRQLRNSLPELHRSVFPDPGKDSTSVCTADSSAPESGLPPRRRNTPVPIPTQHDFPQGNADFPQTGARMGTASSYC